jgi:hypothetical protein
MVKIFISSGKNYIDGLVLKKLLPEKTLYSVLRFFTGLAEAALTA